MSNVKRTVSSSSSKSLPIKRARIEILSGPAANTRSRSKENLKENIQNENISLARLQTNRKIHHQPIILKRTDKKDIRKPLNDLIDKNSQNFNGIHQKTVVIQYQGTNQTACKGPCTSSCCGNCSQTNIRRTLNVIRPSTHKTNAKKEQLIANLPLITQHNDKAGIETEYKIYKTFSNNNQPDLELQQQNEEFKRTRPNIIFRDADYDLYKENFEYGFVDIDEFSTKSTSTSSINYKYSVTTNDCSPFQERNKDKIVIHDGIPSLKKKTLKRDCFKSSGIKGVIDLDPNLNKVHPRILYPETLNEMLIYYLKKESKYILPADYIVKNSKLSQPRAMLVNWLLKIQQYYKSDHGTFFTSVRLFDRILNITEIPVDNIQLIGIVTYWIAMKWNDVISTPKARDLILLCRNEITIQEVLKTEKKVLGFLKFDITIDEPMICVRYYIFKMQIENCDIVAFCSNYLLDCFVLNLNSSTYSLSIQAAAAVYLSLQLLDLSTQYWERLKNLPGYYSPIDLVNLQSKMLQTMQAVQDPEYKFREPFLKYKSEKYGAISVKLLKKQVAT